MNESEAEGVWTVMESGASDSGANAFEEGQKAKEHKRRHYNGTATKHTAVALPGPILSESPWTAPGGTSTCIGRPPSVTGNCCPAATPAGTLTRHDEKRGTEITSPGLHPLRGICM